MSDAHASLHSVLPFAPGVAITAEEPKPLAGFAPLCVTLLPSGLTLTLSRANLLVGRHSTCDVRLPMPDVSRRHCRLFFDSGAWHVEDRDSLNGIFVNDEKVTWHTLQPGDRLRIGGFILVVQPAELRMPLAA